jgi:PAS domain S-box-containing protein
MTLKSKIVLILLCVFMLYGVVNFVIQRFIIFPSFLSLEREEAIRNVKRSVEAIQGEIRHLDLLCQDWAVWDDTYEFIKSRSDKYIESNLVLTSFTGDRINTIYFVDTKGKIIWGENHDLKTGKNIHLPEFPEDSFPANHPLISYKSENKPLADIKVTGVYMTENGPMLISSRPILTSNIEGPVRGSLIFGRFHNDEIIKTLVDQTQVNFQIFPIMDGSLPEPVKDIPNRITDESRYLIDVSNHDYVDSYTTLPDIKGDAAFLIKSKTSRKISKQGYVAILYAMYSMLAAGTAVLIVMLLLLHFSVLSPITDFTNRIMSIGKTGDLPASVSIQRRDEIGILAIEFDRMLERLQKFRTELELKVKERTAELTIANERLNQEIKERKQAEEEVRESEQKYSTLVENSLTGIYIDCGGKIVFANDKFVEIYKYPRDELIDIEAWKLVHPDDRFFTDEMRARRLNGEDVPSEYEAKGLTKDGETIWLTRRNTRIEYNGNLAILGNIANITQRKQAEEALRESMHRMYIAYDQSITYAEELKQEVAERKQAKEALQKAEREKAIILGTMSELVVYVDTNMKILWANQAATHSVGLTADALVGSYCYKEWFHRNDPCPYCPAKRALETGQVQEGETYSPDGRVWFFKGYPVRDASGEVKAIVEVVEDITERKQAEQELLTYHEKLRSLASELSLVEERQRHHVAIEVHDRISQNLAFVKIKLGTLRELALSSELAGTMDDILDLVDETIQSTRTLISELGSPILYELGFVPAVQWLTQQTQNRQDIVLDFKDDGQPKVLSEDVSVLLFQATRELLVNITKHAQASTAKVSIARDGDQIRVDVEDNGVGFDSTEIVSSVDTTGRFGLFSIRVRLEPLGGHMEVKSKPGHGTRVTLIAPLEHNGGNKKEKVS